MIFFVSGFPGYCLDSHGQDQNAGVRHLGGVYEGGEDCLSACRQEEGASGCEYQATGKCYMHTADVATGSGEDDGYTCYVLQQTGGHLFRTL